MGLRERVTASTYRRWLNWALAGMALVLVGQYVAGR
jgi:hypothetical protein